MRAATADAAHQLLAQAAAALQANAAWKAAEAALRLPQP